MHRPSFVPVTLIGNVRVPASTLARLQLVAAVVIGVGGCSAPAPSESAIPTASVDASPSASASPSATESPQAETTLRTLIAAAPESPTLTVERELAGGDGYASAVVSYESGGFTIKGVLHTPAADSPLPGIVFVHGLVDPDTWNAQTEYVDFQDRLVSAGYVVLVPDLRNHGNSDDDPNWELGLEMGTTLDVINAARALAAEPAVDPDRMAVVGHSAGGGLTMNALVVAPDVAAAFVAMAPTHASAWEILQQFVSPFSAYYQDVVDLRGTPEDNPDFWADVSALTFVDRADSPLLVVQGTADDIIPAEWPDVVRTAWTNAGKDVDVVLVEGGDHIFVPVEDEAWAAVFSFLEEQLP